MHSWNREGAYWIGVVAIPVTVRVIENQESTGWAAQCLISVG